MKRSEICNSLQFAASSPPTVPAPLAQQRDVMAALDGSAAVKGYAPFWSTNIYVHRSDGRLAISEVTCRAGRLGLRHWLTDTRRAQIDQPRSFLIWEAGYYADCPLPLIARQVGAPTRVEPIPSPTRQGPALLLIYDHDIGPALDDV